MILILFSVVSCVKKFNTNKTDKFDDYELVSLADITNNPEFFDNEKIALKGYFSFDFELSIISNNVDMTKNVWIDFAFNKGLVDSNNADLLDGDLRFDYSGKEIWVKGTFVLKDKGHLSLSKGTLTDVTYFEILQTNRIYQVESMVVGNGSN